MANKELIEEVGKYIDKYYEPGTDDIKMDEEMKSIFDKITDFRKRRKEQKKQEKKLLITYFLCNIQTSTQCSKHSAKNR